MGGIRQADLTLTAHAAHVQTGAAPSVTLKGTTKDRQVDLTVRLPRDANPEHATAEHANGQLKLAVPKIPKRTIPLVVSSPERPCPVYAGPSGVRARCGQRAGATRTRHPRARRRQHAGIRDGAS